MLAEDALQLVVDLRHRVRLEGEVGLAISQVEAVLREAGRPV
jgi:hypothetical protein